MTTESLVAELDSDVSKYVSKMKQAENATQDFGAKTTSASKSLDGFNKTATATAVSSATAGRGMAGLGRNAGMASIQLQQFVGQIQGGQSAMLALSQQSADLGFVLGAPLVGALVGIGASVASFLIPSLIGAATNVDELKERIKDLGDESEKTVNQIRFLAQENEKEINKLAESNEDLATRIIKAQEEIERMTSAGTGLDTGSFAVPRTAEQNQERYAEKIQETRQMLVELTAEMDTNNQEIIKLNESTTALGEKHEEVNARSQRLTESLQTQIIALQGGAQAAEVYAAVQAFVGTEMEEQLPAIIELINKKYELIDAQKAAAETAKQEAMDLRDTNQAYAEYTANYEMLENFIMTREERLLEQYQREQEMLTEAVELGITTEEDAYARRLELAENYKNNLIGLNKKDAKVHQQTERDKLSDTQTYIRAAGVIANAAFEDNKAINAGIVVADTAVGVQRALTPPFPGAPPNFAMAALIAASGAVQLANVLGASKGGGSVSNSSGSGGGATINNQQYQPETTTLDITSSIAGGSTQTNRVSLDVEGSDDFLDEMANRLAQRLRSS